MTSQLPNQVEGSASVTNASDPQRQLSRSPHPYHRNGSSVHIRVHDPPPLRSENGDPPVSAPKGIKSPKTSSDSGTEADDESTGILRGLPAPPLRPRKGLRSHRNGSEDDMDSWISIFQPLPALLGRSRPSSRGSRRSSVEDAELEAVGLRRQKLRREKRIEVLRRLSEVALLLSVGGVVSLPEGVREVAWAWRKGMLWLVCLRCGCI